MAEEKAVFELNCTRKNCGCFLTPDTQFNTEMRINGIKKRRFKCQNGHDIIVTTETELLQMQAKIIDLTPRLRANKPKPKQYKTTKCDQCHEPIYKAYGNQKRHSGECSTKAIQKKNKEAIALYHSLTPEARRVTKTFSKKKFTAHV
jgi:hypothetical protein